MNAHSYSSLCTPRETAGEHIEVFLYCVVCPTLAAYEHVTLSADTRASFVRLVARHHRDDLVAKFWRLNRNYKNLFPFVLDVLGIPAHRLTYES